MSAADLVAMFHFFFLANPEGLGMDAPHADYETAIWAPLTCYLDQIAVRTDQDRLPRSPRSTVTGPGSGTSAGPR